jgi:hypothetical protein
MLELTSIEDWLKSWFSQGIVVNAVWAAIWIAFTSAAHWLCRRLTHSAERNVLGEVADDQQDCKVLLRWMREGEAESGCYEADWQDSRSPGVPRRTQHPNIPSILAASDVAAAMDVMATLARYDKRDRIEVLSANPLPEVWDHHVICSGGTPQAYEIIRKADKGDLQFDGRAFWIPSIQQPLVALRVEGSSEELDFGLLLKSTHRETRKLRIVVMGTGVLGTEGAGNYLKTNISKLGTLFGKRDFALIVACSGEGGHSAEEYWYYPEPTWFRKRLHPGIWEDFSETVRRKKVIPECFRRWYAPA